MPYIFVAKQAHIFDLVLPRKIFNGHGCLVKPDLIDDDPSGRILINDCKHVLLGSLTGYTIDRMETGFSHPGGIKSIDGGY